MASPKWKILIADDDRFVRKDLENVLKERPFGLYFAETARRALEQAKSLKPDLVLLDLVFPDNKDLTLLRHIKSLPDAPEVIMLSGQADNIALIVEAIKIGAYDFVAKPFTESELLLRIDNALHLKSLKSEKASLVKELQGAFGEKLLLGTSPAMQQVRETLKKLADFEGCVLIGGDSGTGKELAARTLHYSSKRAARPFIVVNCAAIPESLTESILFGHRKGAFTGAIESAKGKFELADDGTIFMDEIGDMPLRQQATLLRVLEYRNFTPVGDTRELTCNARFVFATNRDLKAAVGEGAFREDLYHRINVAKIKLPSLSTRPSDIGELVETFAKRFCIEMGRALVHISRETMQLFERYDWPGNVRELRNVIEASIMLMDPKATEFTPEALPAELLITSGGEEPQLTQRQESEKEAIVNALQKCNGNQTIAAKELGYHRNTIRAKIRFYGIKMFG